MEENRVALISIIVENRESSVALNTYLSEYSEWIVGRMGIPYAAKNVSILAVVVDAPVAAVNALTGKIGRLPGVSAKTLFSKI